MLCKKCNKQVSILDDRCSYCGNDLTKVVLEKRYVDFHKSESKKDLQRGQNSYIKPTVVTEDITLKGKAKEVLKEVSNIPVVIEKLKFILEGKLEDLKLQVFLNRHVIENDEYREKAKKTLFGIDWDNNEVNGGAKEIDHEKYSYLIGIYGGLVNFSCAVVSTFNPNMPGLFVNEQLEEVIKTYKRKGGLFSSIDLIDIMPENKDVELFVNDAAKLIFQFIGHELGHICYGHVVGPPYELKPRNVNIGQEYEADSFSYSIIEHSIFKKELWIGHIQYMIVRSVQEMFYGVFKTETHPLSIDRLKAAIHRFPDLAEQYNINGKWVEEIIDKIFEWLKVN